MPHENGSPAVAAPEDVLAVMTQLMYSDKPADQLKAADMLAKHHGLLNPREETEYQPELIAESEAEVAQIAQEYDDQNGSEASGADTADEAAGAGGPVVRP